MQKRIIGDTGFNSMPFNSGCLDLEQIAMVEVTSERSEYPIESALLPGQGLGWRAGTPGKQTIRLLFDESQPIHSIQLTFLESNLERTQQYVVRASLDHGQSFVEIVRQQWNFHPQGGEMELEKHVIDLPAVTILEVNITPDINDSRVYASLEKLRLF